MTYPRKFVSHQRLTGGTGLLVISLCLAAPAMAQDPAAASDASDNGSQEIVVTAQKRAERLADVPLSITVASQAQLERQQINTIADVARLAPALEIQSAPGQDVGGGGIIRGIGTQSFAAGATSAVGIVVDQVSQGNANIGALFDVNRIEVLKGPQGTLFGLTTSAGVINVVTNAPDPSRFSARVRSELSDAGTLGSGYGRQIVQGVVNIPLAGNAAVRVSGNFDRSQGPGRNALQDDKRDTHQSYNLRGRLLWEPTDAITVNLIGDYSHSKDSNINFFTFTKASEADVQAALAACGITAGDGNNRYCTNTIARQTSKNYGGSAQIDYDAGPFTLTSITSYREQSSNPSDQSIFRLDDLPTQIINGASPSFVKLFTQEVRVASPSGSRLEYTVGGFYSRQHSQQAPFTQTIALNLGFAVIPLVNNYNPENDAVDTQAALFGQTTYHVTDKLSLIGGARFTDEKLVFTQSFGNVSPAITRRSSTLPTNVSWKLGARYEFNRNLNIYSFVAKGYKGPQISIPSDPAVVAAVVRPERPTSYEIGAKGLLFGKMNFDLNAFYLKLKDFQGQYCEPTAGSTLSCYLTNISHITSKGVEASVFGQLLPGFNVNAGVIYNEVTYPGHFLDPEGLDLGHKQLTYAPKWKATISGQYDQRLTDSLTAFLAADMVYKSKVRYNSYVRSDASYQGHVLLGGRVGLHGPDDAWTASIFARNLLNKHEPVIIYPGDNNMVIYTPQSFRQVGLSFDAKF